MWSPNAVVSLPVVDATAPGAPSFAGIVQSGKTFQILVNLPTLDVDESPLSGLKKVLLVSLAAAEPGVDPFGADPPAYRNDPSAYCIEQPLTDDQAGQQISLQCPAMAVGTEQWFALVVSDNPND